MTYSERLEIGYRFFDAHNVTPAYAFGHGLSYTSFHYTGCAAEQSKVTFSLSNVGSVAGAEVAQLYLAFPAHAGEPPKVLRGFKKVHLDPAATAVVTFPLTRRDLSVWSTEHHDWAPVAGTFQALVGASSRDIRLSCELSVPSAQP